MKAHRSVKPAVSGWVLATFIGGSLEVMAGSTADQTVQLTVDALHQITVSGPASLHITTVVAGQAPTPATDAATTYSITSNDGIKKITAKINMAMPQGMVLSATAVAPAGGESRGKQCLSSEPVDLMDNVLKVSETQGLTYELTATAAAGKLSATTRTVTFTIAE